MHHSDSLLGWFCRVHDAGTPSVPLAWPAHGCFLPVRSSCAGWGKYTHHTTLSDVPWLRHCYMHHHPTALASWLERQFCTNARNLRCGMHWWVCFAFFIAALFEVWVGAPALNLDTLACLRMLAACWPLGEWCFRRTY